MSDQLKINHPLRGVRQARLARGGTDSRLVDVGFENGRISGLFEPGTIAAADTIDAGGACLHPGFVDAHLHLSLGGQTLGQLDLAGVSSRGAFEAAEPPQGSVRLLLAGTLLWRPRRKSSSSLAAVSSIRSWTISCASCTPASRCT